MLAHGLRYEPPPLPSVAALWGRSVFHCPFCDGWEVRDHPLAVHGNGPEAARSALVVSGWSRDVVLCTDGPASLGANGARDALARAGVRVREEPIRELADRDGEGRTTVPGVYAAGDTATERLRSVANAMGSGSRVAYSVALDLV